MRLASLARGRSDGALIVVSRDGRRFLKVAGEFATLQAAVERWEAATEVLDALASRLDAGDGAALSGRPMRSPLPRGPRWLDVSAFSSRDRASKLPGASPLRREAPSMRPGTSCLLLGPTEQVPVPQDAEGFDFAGGFGVIVDETPMGVSAARAASHICLLVQINHWTPRHGAGMEDDAEPVPAKLILSAAPFAITPGELGAYWDGRVHLDLAAAANGRAFGGSGDGAMAFNFGELIAHAAATRPLPAGSVVGSGPVFNAGAPATPFMALGDRVRVEATCPDGFVTPFGAIDQVVVKGRARIPAAASARQRTSASTVDIR
jgi:fumarylacetoacetate (FAA) hydrolase